MQPRAVLISWAVLAAVVTTQWASAQTVLGFKMPSRNVYCIIEQSEDASPTDLRCDIQQMNNPMPTPPANCPQSWGDAFSITQNGSSGQRVCHGDTTKKDELPALAYGSVWNDSG